MLSQGRQKIVRSLQSKKGREKTGLCLVEGEKVIETAGNAIEYRFSKADLETEKAFLALVTTDTPQEVAAVAKIPEWTNEEIDAKKTIVILDGVQDPGNVGAILRLCLAFDASLVLIESADVTSPKVVRSSAGALFHVPWAKIDRQKAEAFLKMEGGRMVYRLEKQEGALPLSVMDTTKPAVLIAGSEGKGILLEAEGESVFIEHESVMESLNVGNAVAIALHHRYRS